MGLKVFNTASGRKEDFAPLRPGKVGMYVCGVTVYDFSHLGHARGAYLFDVIRRYLEFSGFEVRYVRNFTDVDDKIIQRANESGVTSRELAERFIGEYNRDMDALGVRRADLEPKATEHIPEIIDIVKGLVDKGYGYVVDGDVYYRVRRFARYGAFSRRTLEDLQAGARVEVDERKEDPLDFALWKSSKPGEPTWDSPWGPGRPGWHIECSAMSMKHLGVPFDIHGGGKDLIFPHHENEIAQSEGYSGTTFARLWMHNGFVNVDKEKMSKSLGNFFTVRDILGKHDAEAVRLFLLSTHYRNPIDFSDKALADAVRSLNRHYLLLGEVREFIRSAAESRKPGEGPVADLLAEVEGLEKGFREAMDDDFNTAVAVGEVFRVSSLLGTAIRDEAFRSSPEVRFVLERYLGVMERLTGVLGVFSSSVESWRERFEAWSKAGDGELTPEAIEELIRERKLHRSRRDWAKADAVRDDLLRKGITLEDGPGGTTWRRTT